MSRLQFTQQSSATLPITPRDSAGVPLREPTLPRRVGGALERAIEGPAWPVIRAVLDFVLMSLAVIIALGGPQKIAGIEETTAFLLALPLLALASYIARGLYRNKLRIVFLDEVFPAISGVSVAAMMIAVAAQLALGEDPPEGAWVRAWVFSAAAVVLARGATGLVQRWARTDRGAGKPVLILGAGVVGKQVARRLTGHPEYGLVPVGFLDDDPLLAGDADHPDLPVLGGLDEIDETVRRTGVDRLIVAFSSVPDEQLSRLVMRCQEAGVAVSVVPRMFDTINDRVRYDAVGGLPLLSFNAVHPKGVRFTLKHVFDRVFALAMIALLSPVLLLTALAVRLSSPGPILFRQRRVGRDGREFELLKFRSMRPEPDAPVEEDEDVLSFLLAGSAPGGVEGADRRTAVGKLMRRTSIDELPQLFNVLRGEMSIVGPRPERPEFVELFRRDLARYSDRHRVKSGITGWAQVHGLRGQTSLADRVEWDNYYINHWSFGLDLKILAMTLLAFFHDSE